MSRSRRKTPIVGHTTARSEKQDKRHSSGRLRSLLRTAGAAHDELGLLADKRHVGHGCWTFAKDGKAWHSVTRIAMDHGEGCVRKLLRK